MKIIVIGIGQSLRADDAAGLEVVRTWQAQHPASAGQVHVHLSELPGLGLLDLLDDMDAAILVDALKATSSAGTVICLDQDELAAFNPDAGSAHGWGVAETLKLGRTLNPALEKCRVILIGIVGKDFSMGAGISTQVRAALAKAADLLELEVQRALAL
jgi:hydrogenase maturation protease